MDRSFHVGKENNKGDSKRQAQKTRINVIRMIDIMTKFVLIVLYSKMPCFNRTETVKPPYICILT